MTYVIGDAPMNLTFVPFTYDIVCCNNSYDLIYSNGSVVGSEFMFEFSSQYYYFAIASTDELLVGIHSLSLVSVPAFGLPNANLTSNTIPITYNNFTLTAKSRCIRALVETTAIANTTSYIITLNGINVILPAFQTNDSFCFVQSYFLSTAGPTSNFDLPSPFDSDIF